jgi:phosphoglucomutase
VRPVSSPFDGFGPLPLPFLTRRAEAHGAAGIKFNCENGGPAPEKVTEKIFEFTKNIAELQSADDFPEIDIATVGTTECAPPARRSADFDRF